MSKAETCVCCGRIIPEGNHYCIICGQKPKQKQRQIDRIRNMSVEELAKQILEFFGEDFCTAMKSCDKDCVDCVKKWLESEVKE